VAARFGIDRVRAGLLPEEKVAAIKELQDRGRTVAMIGAGVNDAPAMAAADVSIAMGASGTDVAMESADIVLVDDRLEKVPAAVELSRRILRIIKQNVFIAVGTVLLLLVGVVTRHVGLGLGMLVHEASVLLVIANGMRLLATGGRGAGRGAAAVGSAPAGGDARAEYAI
ncbi:MAG: HAD-IC family P-type ATPase, partial [Tissierella sp.]|nr:HAD-IC family P-type ATPase [Tissierella sp.]